MGMKIGLGLYRHMLTRDNFRFAKQAGCTHIVAHLVNYFSNELLHGTDEKRNWGVTAIRIGSGRKRNCGI
jgi:mannonate dehydratase